MSDKSGQDLYQELRDKQKQLIDALDDVRAKGKQYAQCEKEYRVELAKEMLIERDKGTPVTILSDICRGKESIADLKRRRDISEAYYKAAIETVNVYKIESKQLEGEIERVWRG